MIGIFHILNKKKIDISVIIPIFNSEKYLFKCLKSVINQSLKSIEIICIDDGSTDNSLQILKKVKDFDKRLIIIHQENKGPAISRNLGIKISKGKFIAFLDSDDIYPNNFTLEFMLNNAIKNKVNICGGGINHFNYINNKVNILSYGEYLFKNNKKVKYLNYQYDYFYQRFIYKKNFLKKNNLYFPNYLRYQDPPFFIKSMGLAKNFYALENVTYLKGLTYRNVILTEKKVIDMFKGLKHCLDISEKMNLNKLYCQIYNRLNSFEFLNVAKIYIKNKTLRILIYKILNNINYNIFKKENFTFIQNYLYNNISIN